MQGSLLDLPAYDIQAASLKKYWFGFTSADGLRAQSAILVNYDCNHPMTAHIYVTGETISGDINHVLAGIGRASREAYRVMTGEEPPGDIKRRFMTQAWQGETRAVANGKLFYVDTSTARN